MTRSEALVAEFVEVETGKGADAPTAVRSSLPRSKQRARPSARSSLPNSIASLGT